MTPWDLKTLLLIKAQKEKGKKIASCYSGVLDMDIKKKENVRGNK
jgi:hypothetical protein